MLMNQQVEKNIQQRSEVSHELANLRKKLETCNKKVYKFLNLANNKNDTK